MNRNKVKSVNGRKPRLFYGWYLVAISWIMSFLVTGTSVGIFFKPILDEYGWDRATLSLVSAISMLVFAVLTPFMGRLIDRFGTRLILLSSITTQIFSSIFNGLSTGIVHIVTGRLLYELKPTHGTQVLINHWFQKKRGKALGILSTAVPLGTLVLSPISQYLIMYWGWRSTFLFWSGVSAVVLLPLLFFIRNKPGDKGLYIDGDDREKNINSYPSHLNRVHNLKGNSAPETGYKLRAAIGLRSFWLLAATQFFCGIGCGLMMTHTVIFATDIGHSAIIGASFLSIQGGISLLGVMITGPLSDRVARHKVLMLVHLIRSISFITMATSIGFSGGSLWLLYTAMALFGFGWFTTAPLAAGLVADLFGNLRMGTILGITLASHMVGAAIGSYGGGLSYQLTGSYLPIFSFQGVLEFTAAIFAFFIIKLKSR